MELLTSLLEQAYVTKHTEICITDGRLSSSRLTKTCAVLGVVRMQTIEFSADILPMQTNIPESIIYSARQTSFLVPLQGLVYYTVASAIGFTLRN